MTRLGTIAVVALLATSARGATVHFADEANGDYRIVGASDIEIDGQLYDFVVEDTTPGNLPPLAWDMTSALVFGQVLTEVGKARIPTANVACFNGCWPGDSGFVVLTLNAPATAPTPDGFQYTYRYPVAGSFPPGEFVDVGSEHEWQEVLPDADFPGSFDAFMNTSRKIGYAVLVPEPTSALLLLLGLVSISWGRAR